MISSARSSADFALFWRRTELREAGVAGAPSLHFCVFQRAAFLVRDQELIVWRDFIDESELQSFLSGIKFAFQNHLGGLLSANQSRQSRAAAPGGKKPRLVSGKPIRVAGSSEATR